MREVLTVSKVDGEFVYLKASVDETTCSSCALAGGCSVRTGGRELRISKASLEFGVVPGDRLLVELKYNEATISMILYGLPLVGFVSGVTLGYVMGRPDVQSFLVGLAGAGLGVLLSKAFDKRFQVRVLEKVPSSVALSAPLADDQTPYSKEVNVEDELNS